MPKPTHAHIERLLKSLILPFYHVKRDMPLPVGERRWENDAEHSWSLALLACSIAPEIDKSLDVGRICQFAVAHDLVEVYADDTSVFATDEKLASKAEREEKALGFIAKEFAHFPWIVQTIEEYERKDTAEAKFVYALDKYIAIAYDYIDEGKLFQERKVTLTDYNKSLETHRTKAHTHPDIAEYYDEVRALLDSHPEFFHPATSRVEPV
jgi:5'-deoxynucleotidase YfbR-like HD superfamily hydrolase